MHTIIFLGGAEFRLPDELRAELSRSADLVIAAVPAGVDVIRIPKIKDDTDTQHAIDVALDRGADRITLAGQLSGRLAGQSSERPAAPPPAEPGAVAGGDGFIAV